MFPSNRVRIMVATKPIDFRKRPDGLAALVTSVPRRNSFSGIVFALGLARKMWRAPTEEPGGVLWETETGRHRNYSREGSPIARTASLARRIYSRRIPVICPTNPAGIP